MYLHALAPCMGMMDDGLPCPLDPSEACVSRFMFHVGPTQPTNDNNNDNNNDTHRIQTAGWNE